MTHNPTYIIAVGKSRTDKDWKNVQVTWGELKERLRHQRTDCTLREYMLLSKEEQGRIKDVGGFVGGELKENGRRTNDNIKCRTLLTIDVDHASTLPKKIAPRYALIVYTTHSHTPEKPRYRVVAPLSRPCDPIEYQAVAHFMAKGLGVEIVDMTSCEPARLMYWAAAPKDAEAYYYQQDGEAVDVDAVLATYKDYSNPAEWSGTPRVGRPRMTPKGASSKVEDPRIKKNIVGAWCRKYDCIDVLEQMIPHLYTPAGFNRYTYVGASGWGGMCVYDNGNFCYSYHETDPLGGQLLNAWDLYRLTHYAHLDDTASATTRADRLPSYTAMMEHALTIPEVRQDLLRLKIQPTTDEGTITSSEQEQEQEQDDSWLSELATDAKGNVANDLTNYAIILRNDTKAIKGRVVYDEFLMDKCIVAPLAWERSGGHLWSDADMAGLALYLHETYKLKSRENLQIAFTAVMQENAFRRNSLKEYLERAEWDGVKRVDSLFIDYLGVADTPLNRAITRKSLVASIARVYRPGCKYDQITVLVGAQGMGKSTILRKLAGNGEFLQDSFAMDAKGNKMQEAVRGAWIVEIPELEGFYKQDMSTIKAFVSKQFDSFRPAYGREYIKVLRTCVFFATTNDTDFLRDGSGNRRFWVLQCGTPSRKLKELTEEEVAQVWAEARVIYKSGKELLYLTQAESRELEEVQKEYDVDSDVLGSLEEFLDILLPEGWDDYSKSERRAYITAMQEGIPYVKTVNGYSSRVKGCYPRIQVSAVEVLNEFFKADDNSGYTQSRRVNTLLRKLEGWIESGRVRLKGGYGRQKVFTKR